MGDASGVELTGPDFVTWATSSVPTSCERVVLQRCWRLGEKHTRTDSKQYGAKRYHCLCHKTEIEYHHSCRQNKSSLRPTWPCHDRRYPRYRRTRGESSMRSAGRRSCHQRRTRHREPWRHSSQHRTWARRANNARYGNRIDLNMNS
jgi:hypothetical protein